MNGEVTKVVFLVNGEVTKVVFLVNGGVTKVTGVKVAISEIIGANFRFLPQRREF